MVGTSGHSTTITRQILILRAQPVSDPRAHRWTSRLICAGVHHQARRFVIRNFGIHRPHPADVVGDFAQVRPQFAQIHSALAVLFEREGRFHQLAGTTLGFDIAAGQGMAVVFFERGLGIEAIHRRATPVHEQKDDAFDALRVVQMPGHDAAIGRRNSGARQRPSQHSRERHHAESIADAAESLAASGRVGGFVHFVLS